LKLIDFGLARRLSGGFTHSGYCGTVDFYKVLLSAVSAVLSEQVGFMAPEVAYCQYGHSAQLASPATDYFSLGVRS
jgi:serine/threonine protein kinase